MCLYLCTYNPANWPQNKRCHYYPVHVWRCRHLDAHWRCICRHAKAPSAHIHMGINCFGAWKWWISMFVTAMFHVGFIFCNWHILVGLLCFRLIPTCAGNGFRAGMPPCPTQLYVQIHRTMFEDVHLTSIPACKAAGLLCDWQARAHIVSCTYLACARKHKINVCGPSDQTLVSLLVLASTLAASKFFIT